MGFTIGQVAERTGFTPSTLRYYEGLGLVAPATRTEAGYRIYDEEALQRLAFISRAKQLGCSLDEIADLLDIWDGELCGPVQRRFHDLVNEKVAATQAQMADLAAFGSQLQLAAAQLNVPPIDGPCSDGCACMADPAPTTSAPIALVATPSDIPIACTLDAGAMPDRLAEWQAVLSEVRRRSTTPDGRLRVEFNESLDLHTIVGLVAAEQQCCAFISFILTFDERGTALEVTAPESAADIIHTVFGKARAGSSSPVTHGHGFP
jgi:MerR family transcriptional regulator, copper efflux regulator